MIKNSQSANKVWQIVADDALSKFDSLLEYQEILSNLAKDTDNFDNFERKVMRDFYQSASHLQMNYLRLGRAKCLSFLGKLKAPDTNDHSVFDEEDLLNVEVQENTQRKKARSKLKNGRINSFRRNSNQQYRIMAKRNACKTSRKRPNNKSLNNKSEISDQKDSKSTKLSNSKQTSHSDTEKIQPMKFCRKRSLKRKAEMIDKLFLESDNRSFRSGYKKPKSHMDPKKFRNTNIDLIYNSINQPIKLKEFEIKVIDFMNDTSADNDPYISKFKQANSSKINDCGLKSNDEVLNTLGDVEVYNVLDCTVADAGFDQKAESDNDLDNNEDDENHDDDDDDHSFKSPESETDDNIEEESTVTQSSSVSHSESIELRNARPQSSCTPLSSVRVHVERGPRTPSPPSLPTSPRGPRSPPPPSFSSRCPRRPRTPPPQSFSPTFPRRPRTPPTPSFSPTSPRRPRTPPPPSFSPTSPRRPHTSSTSSFLPARPRGPRTPPGDAPTSDSEASDDEVRSDSSTMSTAY